MDNESVISQFGEWHLESDLRTWAGEGRPLWETAIANQIYPAVARDTFASLFARATAPRVISQASFTLEDASLYRVSDDHFRRTYWGLRPDFTLRDDGLLVFLEAKGSGVPAKTWNDPKEKLYYAFLSEIAIASRGIFYVIPRAVEEPCGNCLRQHFSSVSNIHVGYVLWEDLLKAISPALLEIAVDELVHVSKGLQLLRQWQQEAASRDGNSAF